MKFIHLKTGWSDPTFDAKVEAVVRGWGKVGYVYYDIKISSKSNNCLVILKKKEGWFKRVMKKYI